MEVFQLLNSVVCIAPLTPPLIIICKLTYNPSALIASMSGLYFVLMTLIVHLSCVNVISILSFVRFDVGVIYI